MRTMVLGSSNAMCAGTFKQGGLASIGRPSGEAPLAKSHAPSLTCAMPPHLQVMTMTVTLHTIWPHGLLRSRHDDTREKKKKLVDRGLPQI